MKVRTIGRQRVKNTVAAPYFANQRSASSTWWCRSSTYLPYLSMNGRPP